MNREETLIKVMLIVVALGAAWLFILLKAEIKHIDETGGLKSLVERVWEGKPQ